MDVEVQTPEERSDHASWGTAVKLCIKRGDCEREAKCRSEREGIGHYVWGADVGIVPSQGAHQRLRASRWPHLIQE